MAKRTGFIGPHSRDVASPTLKMHWHRRSRVACGQVVTSWAISDPKFVTCKKCLAIIRKAKPPLTNRPISSEAA
jgi:hypothetical protein